MNHALTIKNTLLHNVNQLENSKELFVNSPGKDFSRYRKFSFSSVIKLILSMGSCAIKDELYHFYDFDISTPSSSAFVQARTKISYKAFESLFYSFRDNTTNYSLYKGFRLLAIDGSTLAIAYNPNDQSTSKSNGDARSSNNIHINALFDIKTKQYVDLLIQPGASKNENGAFLELVDRYASTEKTIFIADRGYESFNGFEHVKHSGQYFLVRVKDIESKTSMLRSFTLPNKQEFDIHQTLLLTRKQNKEIMKNRGVYKFMPKNQRFDYFNDEKTSYKVHYRIIRFQVGKQYECIVTNLPEKDFSAEEIKELYNLRWGIETSFRELKYAANLISLHSKKVEFIFQEIYARVILYNFSQLITTKVIRKKCRKRKYTYQINFTRAIYICRMFLRFSEYKTPPDVEQLISKELLPVRPGRHNPRNMRKKGVISFLYRFN